MDHANKLKRIIHAAQDRGNHGIWEQAAFTLDLKESPYRSITYMSQRESAVDDKKTLLDEMDNHQFAKSVLSLTPACLKPSVVVPFQNEASTLHYARQIVDLLTCDANPHFPQVEVPVLLVAAEFDRIAGSAASQAVAQLLPRSWCVQVAGASHYCLYDRPDLLCGLMDGFFLNPADNQFTNSQPAEIDCVNQAEPLSLTKI